MMPLHARPGQDTSIENRNWYERNLCSAYLRCAIKSAWLQVQTLTRPYRDLQVHKQTRCGTCCLCVCVGVGASVCPSVLVVVIDLLLLVAIVVAVVVVVVVVAVVAAAAAAAEVVTVVVGTPPPLPTTLALSHVKTTSILLGIYSTFVVSEHHKRPQNPLVEFVNSAS